MPRIKGMNNEQSRFLRALRADPTELPPGCSPSPLCLRRWMRREGFRRAIFSLLDAYRLQEVLQLHAAGASAARALRAELATAAKPDAEARPTPQVLLSLLRLTHQKSVKRLEPVVELRPIYANNRRRRDTEEARADAEREAYLERADEEMTRQIDKSNGKLDVKALYEKLKLHETPGAKPLDDYTDDAEQVLIEYLETVPDEDVEEEMKHPAYRVFEEREKSGEFDDLDDEDELDDDQEDADAA